MQKAAFARQYVMLRPVSGCAGGFIRLEMKQGHMAASVRATQVADDSLRVLMLSGDAATGAVMDLGLMRPCAHRQASLFRENLPAGYAACHTVAVCSDWPDAQLLLYGWLTAKPACTLWQLQERVHQYLSVPAKDGILPSPLPVTPTPRAPALCMLLPCRLRQSP